MNEREELLYGPYSLANMILTQSNDTLLLNNTNSSLGNIIAHSYMRIEFHDYSS